MLGNVKLSCKWILETMTDSKSNIERYKARDMKLQLHILIQNSPNGYQNHFSKCNFEGVYMRQPKGYMREGDEYFFAN